MPVVVEFPLLALITGALLLPAYAADRLVASHLPGVASTLVFPCALVTVEFLSQRLNPFGTWGPEPTASMATG